MPDIDALERLCQIPSRTTRYPTMHPARGQHPGYNATQIPAVVEPEFCDDAAADGQWSDTHTTPSSSAIKRKGCGIMQQQQQQQQQQQRLKRKSGEVVADERPRGGKYDKHGGDGRRPPQPEYIDISDLQKEHAVFAGGGSAGGSERTRRGLQSPAAMEAMEKANPLRFWSSNMYTVEIDTGEMSDAASLQPPLPMFVEDINKQQRRQKITETHSQRVVYSQQPRLQDHHQQQNQQQQQVQQKQLLLLQQQVQQQQQHLQQQQPKQQQQKQQHQQQKQQQLLLQQQQRQQQQQKHRQKKQQQLRQQEDPDDKLETSMTSLEHLSLQDPSNPMGAVADNVKVENQTTQAVTIIEISDCVPSPTPEDAVVSHGGEASRSNVIVVGNIKYNIHPLVDNDVPSVKKQRGKRSAIAPSNSKRAKKIPSTSGGGKPLTPVSIAPKPSTPTTPQAADTFTSPFFTAEYGIYSSEPRRDPAATLVHHVHQSTPPVIEHKQPQPSHGKISYRSRGPDASGETVSVSSPNTVTTMFPSSPSVPHDNSKQRSKLSQHDVTSPPASASISPSRHPSLGIVQSRGGRYQSESVAQQGEAAQHEFLPAEHSYIAAPNIPDLDVLAPQGDTNTSSRHSRRKVKSSTLTKARETDQNMSTNRDDLWDESTSKSHAVPTLKERILSDRSLDVGSFSGLVDSSLSSMDKYFPENRISSSELDIESVHVHDDFLDLNEQCELNFHTDIVIEDGIQDWVDDGDQQLNIEFYDHDTRVIQDGIDTLDHKITFDLPEQPLINESMASHPNSPDLINQIENTSHGLLLPTEVSSPYDFSAGSVTKSDPCSINQLSHVPTVTPELELDLNPGSLSRPFRFLDRSYSDSGSWCDPLEANPDEIFDDLLDVINYDVQPAFRPGDDEDTFDFEEGVIVKGTLPSMVAQAHIGDPDTQKRRKPPRKVIPDKSKGVAPAVGARRQTDGGTLWKFLLRLLCSADTNPHVIRWEDEAAGVFRFIDRDEIARLWAEKKGKASIKYDFLARAVRYYYQKDVMWPVRVPGKRMVFQFGNKAVDWRDLCKDYQQRAAARQQQQPRGGGGQ